MWLTGLGGIVIGYIGSYMLLSALHTAFLAISATPPGTAPSATNVRILMWLALGVWAIGLGLKLKTADALAASKGRSRGGWIVATFFFGWLALLLLALLPIIPTVPLVLGQLAVLHAAGQLSDDEYTYAKAKLLRP
jgi:hypothetical protein